MSELEFWPRFLLCVLATWRVSHLLAFEDGPADLVLRLRARAGGGPLGRMMDCFYCLSLWVAMPFALAIAHEPLDWMLAWLALSGGASLLTRATDGRLSPDSTTTERGDTHGVLWPGPDGPEERERNA